MAALNGAAQAARLEAASLRSHANELKLAVRANVACSRERLASAQMEADQAQACRTQALPSAWSGLQWAYADETLERTLVLLPPRA